jgi:hypothetical protein
MSDNISYNLKPLSLRVKFVPCEDITAFELAQCLPLIERIRTEDWNWNYTNRSLSELTSNVSRHFAIVPVRSWEDS